MVERGWRAVGGRARGRCGPTPACAWSGRSRWPASRSCARRRATRAEALAALRADPAVAWAEADQPRRRRPPTRCSRSSGGSRTPARSVLGAPAVADADLDAPDAWAVSRGAGVTVAIVDTGVDAAIPTSPAALRRRAGTSSTATRRPTTRNGHGTHVAGTIAAAADDDGRRRRRARGDDHAAARARRAAAAGWSSDVAAAFERAAARGRADRQRVARARARSPSPSGWPSAAIRGRCSSSPAGNGGVDGVGDDVEVVREYPCVLTEANVLCVGASGPDDGARPRSPTTARASVDLFAPGVRIVSDFAARRPVARCAGLRGARRHVDGRAPSPPGAAALVAAARPGRGRRRHQGGAARRRRPPAGPGRPAVGGGRLNAARRARRGGRRRRARRAAAGRPRRRRGRRARPGARPAPPAAPAAAGGAARRAAGGPAPRLRGVRLSRRVVRCARRCRPALLRFPLAAPGTVTATLERRRCRARPLPLPARRARAARARPPGGTSGASGRAWPACGSARPLARDAAHVGGRPPRRVPRHPLTVASRRDARAASAPRWILTPSSARSSPSSCGRS